MFKKKTITAEQAVKELDALMHRMEESKLSFVLTGVVDKGETSTIINARRGYDRELGPSLVTALERAASHTQTGGLWDKAIRIVAERMLVSQMLAEAGGCGMPDCPDCNPASGEKVVPFRKPH